MPIRFLSPAAPVSMADEWYPLASADHFWMQRRFDVLRRLLAGEVVPGQRWADVGCGNGTLLLQFRSAFGVEPCGLDLNERALRAAESAGAADLCSYDLLSRNEELRTSFDGVLLLDVLEHIAEEVPFLDAVRFHLKPGGTLVVNVPALEALRSRYDDAAGHHRRYTLRQLDDVCAAAGFRKIRSTYWGLPLLPVLAARSLVLQLAAPDRVIDVGFRPPGRLANRLLGLVSRLEPIPQRLVGSSVMATYRASE